MRHALFGVALSVLVVSLPACNKNRPHVLDYRSQGTEKEYHPVGLPGQSHVGTPETPRRFTNQADPRLDRKVKADEAEKRPKGQQPAKRDKSSRTLQKATFGKKDKPFLSSGAAFATRKPKNHFE